MPFPSEPLYLLVYVLVFIVIIVVLLHVIFHFLAILPEEIILSQPGQPQQQLYLYHILH